MNTEGYTTKKYSSITLKKKNSRFVVIPAMKRTDLAKLFTKLDFKVGAEIGVMRGKYSEVLCKSNPGVKLYAIDAWEDYSDFTDFNRYPNVAKILSEMYEQTVRRLALFNCEIIKKTSMEAVKDFKDGSLDFVYIDANHRYEYVLEDIDAWTKKVRKGGIVAGHDFNEGMSRLQNGVVQAIKDYIHSSKIPYVYVLGKRWSRQRDENRSWFFIKQ